MCFKIIETWIIAFKNATFWWFIYHLPNNAGKWLVDWSQWILSSKGNKLQWICLKGSCFMSMPVMYFLIFTSVEWLKKTIGFPFSHTDGNTFPLFVYASSVLCVYFFYQQLHCIDFEVDMLQASALSLYLLFKNK